ncbi:tetratricopeptide repeat protein [methane-oxidizing endosymbiont of Gigantopelta aegis]|uniref:tetratricopeptide repeat protein n=1 Tax=methane-oxidizing endosymbiont of Gigantopelta aegis TaxID=2794938 RepID=UPI0018DC8978|nr:tetratricopeptide repeat protein [methane-oxidizing endosymbiont of Gigantopelta aegis]
MNKLLINLSLLLISTASFAEYAFSVSEALQLPPFCRGLSIQNFQADAKKLKKNIRVPGQHTQHFCHGMKSILRRNYDTAVSEFEYVETHSTKKHALIPATHLYKAEALGKLGKISAALNEYNKAIKLKKKYPQAYSRLANFYLSLNQKR